MTITLKFNYWSWPKWLDLIRATGRETMYVIFEMSATGIEIISLCHDGFGCDPNYNYRDSLSEDQIRDLERMIWRSRQ